MTSASGALAPMNEESERKNALMEQSLRIGGFRFGPGMLLRAALIGTALAYVQTIAYAFVFDDPLQIEMDPWIQSWKYWRGFFTGHVWSFGRAHIQGNYYRPTFMLWLAGNFSLFKLTPGWWHLTSIAAHLVATALVYVLASRLLRDRWSGGIAALLFGVNPLHLEAVAWVSGIPEVLLTIFFVGALLAFQNWQERKNVGWLAASVGLYALALLSKETALAFLLVFAAWAWTSEERAGRIRSVLLKVTPYVVVTFAYLIVRQHVLGGVVNSNYPRPMTWVVATWPSALWFYLRQMLWPFRLSLFYDFELWHGFTLAATVIPLALVTLAMTALVFLGRKSRLGLITAVWILAPLVPALVGMRVFQWHDYVHDRYTYLPSVMIAIVMAAGLKRLAEGQTKFPALRVQAVCAGAIAITFAAATMIQGRQWESDLALFSHAHERAPRNPLPLDYMARSLYGLGRTEEAIARYHDLLRLDPDYWQGNYVLGLAYYQLGRYDEAEKYLKIATRVWQREFIRPGPVQFYYLGLVQKRNAEYAEAETSLRTAVELRPEDAGYRNALGTVLQQLGRTAEAEEQFRLETEDRKAAQVSQK